MLTYMKKNSVYAAVLLSLRALLPTASLHMRRVKSNSRTEVKATSVCTKTCVSSKNKREREIWWVVRVHEVAMLRMNDHQMGRGILKRKLSRKIDGVLSKNKRTSP